MSLFRKPALPSAISTVNTAITSTQFRQDEKRVEFARKLFANRDVSEMLTILAMESPIKTSPMPPGSSDIDIARAYGIEHGYQHLLAKLLSLGTSYVEPVEPQVEFKDETEPE